MNDNRESKEKVDAEKAIEILSKFTNNYFGDKLHGGQVGVVDIIELLKEQEPAKVRHLHGTKVTVHEEIVFTDECENCSSYLLKHWKACPICGKPVIWE